MRNRLFTASAIGTLAIAGLAHAQTAPVAAPATDQGDIVVTAQKRSETVQKIGRAHV